MEFSEELNALYFTLQQKNPKPKEDLYAMTEIRNIIDRAQEILSKEEADHDVILAFNKVLEKIKYFENYGASSEFFENIIEVKQLAIQAFLLLFDRG